MKRAILSVSDKRGLVDFARGLVQQGFEIISTGGTALALQQAGLTVRSVSELTAFPECLDGRVKTLHPHIFGGILARRDDPAHQEEVAKLKLQLIDLVVINLYPFKDTIQRPGVTEQECIENIDIGGPSLLRAAAKNFQSVTVVADPQDYGPVLSELQEQGKTTLETRRRLAAKVFQHTAAYDALIAGYFGQTTPDLSFPQQLSLTFEHIATLRYGENPDQQAAFYGEVLPLAGALTAARQLQGKALSYNNIADTDAALALIKEFSAPTVVAIKHANPCGVASDTCLMRAWEKAYAADSVSIFGGIVALNRPVTQEVAAAMSEVFLEVILAPAYEPGALEVLAKKQNLRLLELPELSEPYAPGSRMLKQVYGGLLIQDFDRAVPTAEDLQVVTQAQPQAERLADYLFAQTVVKHVKSNAIVLVKDLQTVGIGPGQPNRVTSARIAIENAGEAAQGAILGSDAFFPFRDTVDAAIAAGVSGIIQPGGSIRDDESIAACDEAGIPMIMTGKRHFRH